MLKLLSIKDNNGDAIVNPEHIASTNPFRYRGYYYDTETNLYYLNSRYYDAEICRFIIADDRFDERAGINGYNLFTYCGNCPNIFKDINGNSIGVLVAVAGCIFLLGIALIIGLIYLQVSFWRDFERISYAIISRLENGFRNMFIFAEAAVRVTAKIKIDEIKEKAKQLMQAIKISISLAGKIARYKTDYEHHHIVAKTDRRADPSRKILRKPEIDIGLEDKVYNKVWIKTLTHRRLHTGIYYIMVNSAISGAYNIKIKNKTAKKRVQNALSILKQSILDIDKVMFI